MVDEQMMSDDASHYEVSLTAGQAFVAFVLLLFSLAASFAFGVLIGKGQVDERLVVRHDPNVIQEARGVTSGKGKIVELGVDHEPAPSSKATLTEEPAQNPEIAPGAPSESAASPGPSPSPSSSPAAASTLPAPPASTSTAGSSAAVPHYAQLLSSSDAKTAEALAAKLIDHGFTGAYVEHGQTPHGNIFRVRVKFASEAEARAAVERLKSFAGGEVWITRQ